MPEMDMTIITTNPDQPDDITPLPVARPDQPAGSAIALTDVVAALEFLRNDVFSQANITHVQDIVANLHALGVRAQAAYQTVKQFVADRRAALGRARSLELTRALDQAGVAYIYDQFESHME